MNDMQALIGRTIEHVSVCDGESMLAFDTADGPLIYEVDGDCCSESWFSDIENVAALIGGTVTAVQSDYDRKDYNVDDGRGRQEADSAYFYDVTTDRGTATIVFRNSSNGYYGGSLRLMPNNTVAPGGFGRIKQRIPQNCSEFHEITADWKSK